MTPIQSTDIRVLKPHGSCNFLTKDTGKTPTPYLFAGSMVEAGIDAEDPAHIKATLEALNAEPLSTRRRFVVMSNYASAKRTPLSPAQITQVRLGSRHESKARQR